MLKADLEACNNVVAGILSGDVDPEEGIELLNEFLRNLAARLEELKMIGRSLPSRFGPGMNPHLPLNLRNLTITGMSLFHDIKARLTATMIDYSRELLARNLPERSMDLVRQYLEIKPFDQAAREVFMNAAAKCGFPNESKKFLNSTNLEFHGSFAPEFLSTPRAMCVDHENGHVYVSQVNDSIVLQFDYSGRLIRKIPFPEMAIVSLLMTPDGLMAADYSRGLLVHAESGKPDIDLQSQLSNLPGTPRIVADTATGDVIHFRAIDSLANLMLMELDLSSPEGTIVVSEGVPRPVTLFSQGKCTYSENTFGDLFVKPDKYAQWQRLPHSTPCSPRTGVAVGDDIFIITNKLMIKYDHDARPVFATDLRELSEVNQLQVMQAELIITENGPEILCTEKGCSAIHRFGI